MPTETSLDGSCVRCESTAESQTPPPVTIVRVVLSSSSELLLLLLSTSEAALVERWPCRGSTGVRRAHRTKQRLVPFRTGG